MHVIVHATFALSAYFKWLLYAHEARKEQRDEGALEIRMNDTAKTDEEETNLGNCLAFTRQ
jgi:hypothetical protein